ncbi:MAG: flagellar hook-associated protein 3 [Clostridiales bacterium]|nr:flagellar hook-associated protein 3 [Clostridiales bacterium]
MRVTNSMVVNNLLSSLGKNATRLAKYQNQVSTGKRIEKLSDDPVGASYSIRYNTDIEKENQYLSNIESSKEILTATETALTSTNEVLARMRELTVQAAGAAPSDSTRQSIKVELEQLRDEIISLGNTTYNGRYIFSGYKTNKELLTDEGTYAITVEDTEQINYQISENNIMQVNTLGTTIFGLGEADAKPKMLADIDKLITMVDSGSAEEINACLTDLDDAQDKVLAGMTEIGGKMNRLELSKSRVVNNVTYLEEAKSLNDDVDTAEAVTNLYMEKATYSAALQIGATVIQQSLLDFLR